MKKQVNRVWIYSHASHNTSHLLPSISNSESKYESIVFTLENSHNTVMYIFQLFMTNTKPMIGIVNTLLTNQTQDYQK